jgi:hypothetical protein
LLNPKGVSLGRLRRKVKRLIGFNSRKDALGAKNLRTFYYGRATGHHITPSTKLITAMVEGVMEDELIIMIQGGRKLIYKTY